MPNGGRPLEFRYYVQTNDQNTVKTAPFIQDWLKQIGIKTDVTAMTSGRLGDEINAGTYDLFHWGWLPDPDPDSQLSYFTCDQRPGDPGGRVGRHRRGGDRAVRGHRPDPPTDRGRRGTGVARDTGGPGTQGWGRAPTSSARWSRPWSPCSSCWPSTSSCSG